MLTAAFGATGVGRVMVTRCSSPFSGKDRKIALAPATDAVFTLALELSRNVKVVPAVVPTFVAFRVAVAFRERSASCRFALMSKLLTCQMTRAVSSCAVEVDPNERKRKLRSVVARRVFIYDCLRLKAETRSRPHAELLRTRL